MTDPLDEVLQLVAEGRLTAEEAAPIIDALQAGGIFEEGAGEQGDGRPRSTSGTTPRALRIEVTEGGRKVVNLRVPLSLGGMAFDHVPGLSSDTIMRIREALDQGMTGPILVVDEGGDGDGVRMVIE